MRIKAVLFDLGDTLWHFPNMPPREVRVAQAAARVEEMLRGWALCDGVDCAGLVRAIEEADWKQSAEAYASDYRSPNHPSLTSEVAAAHGIPLTPQQAVELWHACNPGGIFLGREVFPDSIPTLRWLRERGYRLGTVTNRSLGGQPFREELAHHGMLDLFETLAVSCDDGWLKPAPQLFQKALNELGVQPHEAVMVGDSMRADVMGAKALGMTAIWKRPPRPVEEDARLPDGSLAVPDFTIDHPGALQFLQLFRDT